MDHFYIKYYLKLINSIIHHNNHTSQPPSFNSKYSKFITQLILNSQLNPINLLLSLYYLYKYYNHNSILNHSTQSLDNEENNLPIYLVIISLILSNKCFDDQSYTLKTWLIIINNTNKSTPSSPKLNIDLKFLNHLEGFFCTALNFNLSFTNLYKQHQFWHLFQFDQLVYQKFNCLIENRTVSNSTTTTTPVFTTTCLTSSISPSSSTSQSLSLQSPFLINNYGSSPTTTTTITSFSSPLNYPLTPLTPYDSKINATNVNSCKRRKITMGPSQPHTNLNHIHSLQPPHQLLQEQQLMPINNNSYQLPQLQQFQFNYPSLSLVSLPLPSTQQYYHQQPMQQLPVCFPKHYYNSTIPNHTFYHQY